MNATATKAHRAGRLILAAADDDVEQTIAILHESAATPGGVLDCVLELAGVAQSIAQAVYGEQWRSIMVDALNDLELG